MNAEDSAEFVAAQIGTSKIERAVLEGRHGYQVTSPHGAEIFHDTLGSAIRALLKYLGHEGDRDLFILGDGQW